MLSASIALVGAFIYGAADFFGGRAARGLRSIVVTAVAALTGLVLLLALLPVMGGVWTPGDVAWGALSGVFGVIAIALLYACLAIGPMSILSPVTAVTAAIAPMIWGLTIGGESLNSFGYAGLGIALVAVVLVGFIPGKKVVRPSGRGVLMAIGSGLAIGGFMISIDQTSAASGLVPLVMNRVANASITVVIVLVLILVTTRRGRPLVSALRVDGIEVGMTPTGHADLEHTRPAPAVAQRPTPHARFWLFAIICGVLDVAANTMMLVALRLGDLSIVSALTALYPSGTIILAAIVLRERVATVQWVGLGLALAAGVLLALA
ncbi:hypothetical protein GCM10009808_15420 [Microbacterium sediminicola]|uniref:EamA domain-containing protein n=1 Tax=Microbacterium sediminicola TaxID=415210 RepID=A0ABN2I560_9MICO